MWSQIFKQNWLNLFIIFFKGCKKGKKKNDWQAAGQTLPNATPPVCKIYPFSKIAVTFEPMQRFRCPSRLEISEKCQFIFFMTGSNIFNRLGVEAP